MKQYITLLLIALVFLGSSCTSKDDVVGDTHAASLRVGWIYSASFSGEVAGMNKFANDHNLELSIHEGGPGLNSIQLVQTGQNTFGTIAADEVLAANDRGADFVIVGVINYYSPGGFVALVNSNIQEPTDFEGRRVGLLPFGSTTLLYESMLRKNNVNRSRITEITTSADLRPFLDGRYDIHPVFVYDETVSLERQGIEYNLIEPKNYGVTIKGPVYFTKRETLERRPEMVEAFVKTMADGWNYVIENPDSAIVMLKEFAPEIDKERERQVLEKGIPYFSAYQNQPINSDIESWKEMESELKNLNIINNAINLERVLHLEFINNYYSQNN